MISVIDHAPDFHILIFHLLCEKELQLRILSGNRRLSPRDQNRLECRIKHFLKHCPDVPVFRDRQTIQLKNNIVKLQFVKNNRLVFFRSENQMGGRLALAELPYIPDG